MNQREAIRIAVECMESEKHKYAVDANLTIMIKSGVSPSMQKSHDRYVKIAEAIKVLQTIPNTLF